MTAAGAPPVGASTRLIALALLAGLALGVGATTLGDGLREPAVRISSMIGGLWLDALRMTIVPLLFALLVKGVIGGTRALSGGRIAVRSVSWFLGLSFLSAIVGALVTPALLSAFPLPAQAVQALRGALGTVDTSALDASIATTADYLRSFVPTNPIKAAADGSMLQVMVFGIVFGLAVGHLPDRHRDTLLEFFDALGQAMLVIVGWVLVAAPLGVFALAFALGAGTGLGAFGAVAHYILIYSLAGLSMLLVAYGVAIFAARLPPAAFAKALLPVQSFALSTQSSTASLPLMLNAARKLGISETTRDITLPMAVALFRVLGPAMNIAVCFYIAHWLGIDLGPGAIAAGIAVATFASMSSPGLPGQISFVTSIGPIAIAMGLPLAPLGIFIALEPIPDMLRTLTNVTTDVAVAGAVDRSTKTSGEAD